MGVARLAVAWLSLLLSGWALAQQPSPQAALPEAVQREMQAVQELLIHATTKFDSPQQGNSINLFDEIIARLENLRRQGTLPPRGRDILVQAYELRGRAYYNLGLQEKASDSFRSLIQLQPQYTLSKEKMSPKVVEHFTSVKKALVGYLAVSSDPAGARVSLNGEFLSLTPFFPIEVLAGEYILEIAREGYRTHTETVSISPREPLVREVQLTRTSASCYFITEPAGVEIWVDGELKATTAGSLSQDPTGAARAQGLNLEKASARTEVANLSLGSHVVEFRKKCYETVRGTIELGEPRDYEQEPVRLEESLAALTLRSDPPGARIFLDGEALGQTPRELEGICSGKHRLEVKHAAGKFIQEIVLAKDEALALDCPIRPSLAFLGVVAESPAGERIVAEVEEKLVQNLSKITTLNFVRAPRDTVDRILEAERVTRKNLTQASGTDPDVIRRVTEKLAGALEVQGFLVAVIPEERLQRTADLHLLAAGNTVSEPRRVTVTEQASFLRFISAVDQKATVYRPWTGLITVDTLLHEGVPVLRIVAGSPAAQAGLEVGEVVYSGEGKPVRRTADLLALVESKKPGDRVSLHVRGASGSRAVELTLGETPQEIPLYEPTLLYNKVMMDLLQQVEGYPGTEPAAFARLNLAVCHMHFNDFAAAHEHLLKARSELPQRPGISQGTALYYLGLSLEKLGYKKEALESYRSAAAHKDATLFNNDGPAVAPLAARRGGL